MKKILFLILSLILVTINLCACNSHEVKSDGNSNSSSQSKSTSNEVKYASDSVRYDCNGYPLNQYDNGKWAFGETFGASNEPYRTQITEIATSDNSTRIYTYENTIGFKNYVYFIIDNNKVNVSGLNVHDWVRLYFDTDGEVIKIR